MPFSLQILRIKGLILIFTLVILVISISFILLTLQSESFFAAHQTIIDSQQLAKTYTLEELKKYDGSDPGLPILLSLEGLVYDVTVGSEFYALGGPYHDLAGKDSTQQLRLFGGGIIKRKYPVVGKLER